MKATQQLKEEHEEIKILLNIMEKISKEVGGGKILNTEHFGKILEFVKGFADKNHHGKEETILFPAMQAKGISLKGGPIGVMIHEHDLGRDFIKSLTQSFEAYKLNITAGTLQMFASMLNYVNLLRSHIEKENNILFNMADKVLNEQEQDELFSEYEKIESEVVGKNKMDEYRKLLKELKSLYL